MVSSLLGASRYWLSLCEAPLEVWSPIASENLLLDGLKEEDSSGRHLIEVGP